MEQEAGDRLIEAHRWRADAANADRFRQELWLLCRAINRMGFLPVLTVEGAEFVLSALRAKHPTTKIRRTG